MTNTQRVRRTGKGTVMVIAVLLMSSAMLRLGPGAGEALAQALTTKEDQPATVSNQTETEAGGYALQHTDTGSLLQALLAREKRVQELESQIQVRSKALTVADEQITRRLAALEEAEANLRRTLALADGAAEDDLARLTTVYENMKPKDAAAVFEAMEPDFAAGFLGRMRPDAAAAVMAGLTPETAYSISVILAGRNALAPKT